MSSNKYWGSSVIPVVYVEITPIILQPPPSSSSLSSSLLPLCNVSCKYHLQRQSQQSLKNQYLSSNTDETSSSHIAIEWINKKGSTAAAITTTSGSSSNNNENVHDRDRNDSSLSCGYLYNPQKEIQQRRAKVLMSKENRHAVVSEEHKSTFPIYYFPSDNPIHFDTKQPCCVKAYVHTRHQNNDADMDDGEILPLINDSCLIHILPPTIAAIVDDGNDDNDDTEMNEQKVKMSATPLSLQYEFSGEIGNDFLPPKLENEVIRNHNPETIQELTLIMKRRLQSSNPILIGTTHNAFEAQRKRKIRTLRLQKSIRNHCMRNKVPMKQKTSYNAENLTKSNTHHDRRRRRRRRHHHKTNSTNNKEPNFIIVHSPNHGEGKTTVVQAIANKLVGCTNIHLIRPGYLIAKYGINADIALESMLHSIVIRCAASASSSSVCIILDQLDAMLPSRLSGRSSTGDATEPVLTAMASYLRKLSLSLQQKNEFPFPINNKLYGGCVGNSASGTVLQVRICLVGIITCPDDGWKSSIDESGSSGGNGGGIFDVLIATRYRIAPTTSKSRMDAFLNAFNERRIVLDKAAIERLPGLAQGFHSARGSAFSKVARTLLLQYRSQQEMVPSSSTKKPNTSRSSDDDQQMILFGVTELEQAIDKVKNRYAATAKNDFGVSTQTSAASPVGRTGDDAVDSPSDLFGAVGGAVTAKVALEDALALSKEKRILLARFGMSPPTGVLLYGPPGCGKTLLAKAVARLLKRSSPSATGPDGVSDPTASLGGSFLSISSSDIVSSEIGTSEKVLLSAFEFADKNAPAVIFFDEFQALFTERNRGGSGRLASTLLQCMDDVRRWREGGVFIESKRAHEDDQSSPEATAGPRVVILGATNTPWMVDPAFLRPGRFDRVVHVGLPDEAERKSILMVHLRRMKMEIHNNHVESSLESLAERIANSTIGFSGADLAALCRAAALRALLEDEDSTEAVSEAHFFEALKQDVAPSSDENLIQRLRGWMP